MLHISYHFMMSLSVRGEHALYREREHNSKTNKHREKERLAHMKSTDQLSIIDI